MKEVFAVLLICMLLVSPLVSAEETQTYTGFNRFVDNVKLFFSSGDNKVMLALEIRNRELNSAIANIQQTNLEEANENLENAIEKLILVQERVSSDSADEVEESSNEIINQIEKSDLTEELDRYILEEEKTQLVAELVVEINGKEGQTLTREVVQSENENRKTVRVTIQNENGEIEEIEVEGEVSEDHAVWEIVKGINEVDEGIKEWVVERTYAEGTTAGGEVTADIKTRIIEGDEVGDSGVVYEGGEQYVETSGGENREFVDDICEGDNCIGDVDSGSEGIVGYQGDDAHNADGTIRDEVVEGDGGEGDYAEGTTAGHDISEEAGGEGSSVDE